MYFLTFILETIGAQDFRFIGGWDRVCARSRDKRPRLQERCKVGFLRQRSKLRRSPFRRKVRGRHLETESWKWREIV